MTEKRIWLGLAVSLLATPLAFADTATDCSVAEFTMGLRFQQQSQGDIGTTAIGNVLDKRVACAFIQGGNVRGLRPDPPCGGLTGKLLAAAEQVRVDGSGNLDVLNVAIHDGPLAVCAVVALCVWRPVPGVQPEYATSMPTPMSRSMRAFCMHALLS